MSGVSLGAATDGKDQAAAAATGRQGSALHNATVLALDEQTSESQAEGAHR
jgi:hypothetical protein